MEVLIIDHFHETLVPLLKEIGVEPLYEPTITSGEVEKAITNVDGIILRSKTPITEALIKNAPKLKFIARGGAGLDQIDIHCLKNRNIRLISTPEGNRNAVAEHAMGLLLSLLNKIPQSNQEVKNFIWDREKNRGEELSGKTVGIIGYGNMGQSFAKKLKSFDCVVIAYDKYKQGFADGFVKEVTLEEIQAKSDILSLHTPLTQETKGMIDESFMSSLKKNIYLINTSRGEVLPTEVVLNMLKAGKIKGAALDVLENENIRELEGKDKDNLEKLASWENIILTPHIAGLTYESNIKINEAIVSKIKALLDETAHA